MKKSFGLIEVLISVGILAMFLGGLLALSASGTKLTLSAERRVQAANLARDGMEKVRALWETYNLSDDPFAEPSNCYGFNPPDDKSKHLIRSSGDCKLPYSIKSDNKYGLIDLDHPDVYQDITSLSVLDQFKYAREIFVDSIETGDSTKDIRRVTIRVHWKEGVKLKNIQIISYLTNWRER